MEAIGGKKLWLLLGIVAVIIILAFVGGRFVEQSHEKRQAADLQEKMQEAAKTLQKQSEEMKKAGEQMQQQSEEARKAAEEMQKQFPKK